MSDATNDQPGTGAPAQGQQGPVAPITILAQYTKDLSFESPKAPASLARQDGPLLIMNETGSKAPLIWCFNTWAEALLLGRSLDPNQPLIAMISLNFITMPEPRKANN